MKWWHSFYVKLALVLLALLVVLGGLQIWLMFNTARQFVQEVDQRLNRNLAQDMAKELQPALTDSINHAEAGHRIHFMMVMNPNVEIYLLDATGRILAFFAEPGKEVVLNRVSVEPIRRFLAQPEHFPVLGEDPRHPGAFKPFSAAPIQYGNQQGYLYIILGSQEYHSAAAMVLNSYIFRTSVRFGILFIGVSALIGLLVFGMLTRRLRRVTEAVTAFDSGEMDTRLSVSGKDEIAQLGQAFHRMAERIRESFRKLREQDEQRRQLIANVSHDLRSPLASIQGYLETIMMKWETLTPEQQRQYLKITWNNTRMLNQLIEELFELSRLDARQIQPRLEPMNIAELVQDVVLKFQPHAEQKSIHLEARWPEKLPPVAVDVGLMDRALSNLLDNAVRYTPPEGTVSVNVEVADGKIRVQVSDTGPGIPPEDEPYIFDRFYQVDKSRSSANGGAGLGLAIAQRIVGLHNSRLFVKSRPGSGTAFWFDLECCSTFDTARDKVN